MSASNCSMLIGSYRIKMSGPKFWYPKCKISAQVWDFSATPFWNFWQNLQFTPCYELLSEMRTELERKRFRLAKIIPKFIRMTEDKSLTKQAKPIQVTLIKLGTLQFWAKFGNPFMWSITCLPFLKIRFTTLVMKG